MPKLLLASLLVVAAVWAQKPSLAIPTWMPKVQREWTGPMLEVWKGVKKRNIDAYTTGLIHRPKSEMPGDAVSEGVAYGMYMAFYHDDQATFNRIWDAGEKYMWQGKYYNWRVNATGTVTGGGAATDADQDIALLLIFADKLVKSGKWEAHKSPKDSVTYAERAQAVLNSMWSTGMISEGKYLAPGAGWGGSSFVNPGYFAPAYYRIFELFDAEPGHSWQAVIDQCYATIEANPGYTLGMVPDWMQPNGQYYSGSLGYNPFGGGRAFYKDAIRVLWRIATDALWFDEPQAKNFLQNSVAFLRSKGGASAANFYDLQGNVVSKDSMFVFKGGELTRPRFEHSHLTIGMWATAAMGAGAMSLADSLSDALAGFYQEGNDFFGKASDPGGEDTLHNEMYFDQFLGWYGAAILSGIWSNVPYDIDHPAAVGFLPRTSVARQEVKVHCSTSGCMVYNATRQAWTDLRGREITAPPDNWINSH